MCRVGFCLRSQQCLICCTQVVHSGDIICEGIIRIQKEPVKPEPPREQQPAAQTAAEAEPVQDSAAQPLPTADGSSRKGVKPQPKQEDSAMAMTKVGITHPRLHTSAALPARGHIEPTYNPQSGLPCGLQQAMLRDCAVQGPAKDDVSHGHLGMNGYSKLNGHKQDANSVVELETPESSYRGNGSQTSEVEPQWYCFEHVC